MGFWGYAKTRLSRFTGMNPSTFYLQLKECEFRFNHRGQNFTYTLSYAPAQLVMTLALTYIAIMGRETHLLI